jgi:hypothetical protein
MSLELHPILGANTLLALVLRAVVCDLKGALAAVFWHLRSTTYRAVVQTRGAVLGLQGATSLRGPAGAALAGSHPDAKKAKGKRGEVRTVAFPIPVFQPFLTEVSCGRNDCFH